MAGLECSGKSFPCNVETWSIPPVSKWKYEAGGDAPSRGFRWARVRFGRIFDSFSSHVCIASDLCFLLPWPYGGHAFIQWLRVPGSSFPVACLWVRGCWFLVLRSWLRVPGSWLRVPGFLFLVLAAGFVPGSWFIVLGFCFVVPGYFLVPGSRSLVRGSWPGAKAVITSTHARKARTARQTWDFPNVICGVVVPSCVLLEKNFPLS